MKWLPIDTAPKTLDAIALWNGYIVMIGTWHPLREEWEDVNGYPFKPTHWMPLPSAPALEEEVG